MKFYIRKWSDEKGAFVDTLIDAEALIAKEEGSREYFQINRNGNCLRVRHSEKTLILEPCMSNLVSIGVK